MRGKALIYQVLIVTLCGTSPAQRVQFTPAEKAVILERMKTIPETNAERASKLKELFSDAGCNGRSLVEQRVDGVDSPNIICRLGTDEGDTVIVGAHYDRNSSAQQIGRAHV